jgi:DNA-binding response OmpR family regulator
VASKEALSILRNEPVDLLIQDIMRPDMDGWTFYRMMKSEETLRNVPVLIATARRYEPMNLLKILTTKQPRSGQIPLTTAYPPLRYRLAMNLVARIRRLPVVWVDGYLCLPVHPKELVAAIQKILEKHQAVPHAAG